LSPIEKKNLIFDGAVQVSQHDAQLNLLMKYTSHRGHVSFTFLAQAKLRIKLTSAYIIKEMSNYPYFFSLFVS
jgi:hypothetical protein